MLIGEIAYTGDQIAYLSQAAQDYSLQTHALRAALEGTADRFRLGAEGTGELYFTGLDHFRGLEWDSGVGAWVALDETLWSTTRLDLVGTYKSALNPEFAYLTGTRGDVLASHQLRLSSLVFGVGYHYRYEDIGHYDYSVSDAPSCTAVSCTYRYAIPMGYQSQGANLTAHLGLTRWFAADLAAGMEGRWYAGQTTLIVTHGTTTTSTAQQRQDVRYTGHCGISVELWRHLSLETKYDLVMEQSNVKVPSASPLPTCVSPATCSALSYDNKNYIKHVVMIALLSTW
jgi:hypothetical protein